MIWIILLGHLLLNLPESLLMCLIKLFSPWRPNAVTLPAWLLYTPFGISALKLQSQADIYNLWGSKRFYNVYVGMHDFKTIKFQISNTNALS